VGYTPFAYGVAALATPKTLERVFEVAWDAAIVTTTFVVKQREGG
jgi:hypothetical protein